MSDYLRRKIRRWYIKYFAPFHILPKEKNEETIEYYLEPGEKPFSLFPVVKQHHTITTIPTEESNESKVGQDEENKPVVQRNLKE